MVLKPTLSLTLPSLKDDIVLDCRVYIPTTLYDRAASTVSPLGSSTSSDETRRGAEKTRGGLSDDTNGLGNAGSITKRKKAAIVGHPYAPLGGSFDDYIVQTTAGILLKQGFVVGLFNFRGAAGSKGKTSWNAKQEVSDYHSFVGFMAVFMHHLNLGQSPDTDTYDLTTIPSQLSVNPVSPPVTQATPAKSITTESPLLLLAGYSYGSLIASMLPPLPTLLAPFKSPTPGSAASEIRLRAQNLAEAQNTVHAERLKHASEAASKRQLAASRKVSAGLRVGGDETPDAHRTSLDSHHGRRSLRLDRLEPSEWGRRSVERVRSLRKSLDGSRARLPTTEDAILKWDPARLISLDHGYQGYALLALDQPLDNLDLFQSVWERAGYRIAADGGGNKLHGVFCDSRTCEKFMKEIPLEVIHGDLDSLHHATRSWAQSYSTELIHDSTKDSTDFTNCVSYIAKHYLPRCSSAPDILILGGQEGCVDQDLPIQNHLYKARQIYPQGRIYVLSSSAITLLLTAGTHQIAVNNPQIPALGRNIGISPVDSPAKITTSGLGRDVEDLDTNQMSPSNVARESEITITTSADLLVTIGFDDEASEAPAATALQATTKADTPLLEFGNIDAAYLLISPIQGVVGGLATMFSTTPVKAFVPSLSFFSRKKESHSGSTTLSSNEGKLAENRTLVVFGYKDTFSNADKMRRWAQKLESIGGGRFTAIEVPDGGHFWHQREELDMLRSSVETWVKGFGC